MSLSYSIKSVLLVHSCFNRHGTEAQSGIIRYPRKAGAGDFLQSKLVGKKSSASSAFPEAGSRWQRFSAATAHMADRRSSINPGALNPGALQISHELPYLAPGRCMASSRKSAGSSNEGGMPVGVYDLDQLFERYMAKREPSTADAGVSFLQFITLMGSKAAMPDIWHRPNCRFPAYVTARLQAEGVLHDM